MVGVIYFLSLVASVAVFPVAYVAVVVVDNFVGSVVVTVVVVSVLLGLAVLVVVASFALVSVFVSLPVFVVVPDVSCVVVVVLLADLDVIIVVVDVASLVPLADFIAVVIVQSVVVVVTVVPVGKSVRVDLGVVVLDAPPLRDAPKKMVEENTLCCGDIVRSEDRRTIASPRRGSLRTMSAVTSAHQTSQALTEGSFRRAHYAFVDARGIVAIAEEDVRRW